MNTNTSNHSEQSNSDHTNLGSDSVHQDKSTIGWAQIRSQLPEWLFKPVQLSIPAWALGAVVFITLMLIFD